MRGRGRGRGGAVKLEDVVMEEDDNEKELPISQSQQNGKKRK